MALIGLVLCGTFLQAGLQMGADQLAEFIVGALWVAPAVLGVLFLFGPLFFVRVIRLVGLLQTGERLSEARALEFFREGRLVPFRMMLLSMLTWVTGTPLLAWWMIRREAMSLSEALLTGVCCLFLGMTTSVGYYFRSRRVFQPVMAIVAAALPPDFKPALNSSISDRLFWSFMFIWVAITGSLGVEAYFALQRSELTSALAAAHDRIEQMKKTRAPSAAEDLGFFSLRPFIVDSEGEPVEGSRLEPFELAFLKTHHRFLGAERWKRERSFHAYLSGRLSGRAAIPEFARLPDRPPEAEVPPGEEGEAANPSPSTAGERWLLLAREPLVGGLHPGVAVSLPGPSSFLADRQKLALSMLAVFLLAALGMAGLFSAGLSREVSGSILELKQGIEQDAREAGRRLVPVKSDDELGELAASFNRLMLSLDREFTDRERQVSAMADLMARLDRLGSELSGISSEQAADAAEQAVSMQEISSTSEEIAATLRSIAENAQSVEEVAGKSLSACHDGQSKLDELIGRLDAATDRTVEVGTRMLSLQEQADRIEGILDFIREISEKTNLISLNASIEASSAGAAGERFSIIAQEIRKLAESTMTGTTEIQELFSNLQAASSKAIIATEEGEKGVALARQLADQAAESFQTIIHWAGETARAAHEIAISSGQQTTATDHLASALAELREVAARFADRAGNLEETVGGLKMISPTPPLAEGEVSGQPASDKED